jgi:hypothetical protein
MKSYTDIEQSKKLAEILPLESADMMYDRLIVIPFNDGSLAPCWSLAALLRLMPKRYNDDKVYMPLVGRYYEGNHKFICGYFGDGLLDCTFGETSINACYEMIIKLHEQNLL